MTFPPDKRSRVDMSTVPATMQAQEIEKLKWLSSNKQLAEALTKERLFLEKSFASSPNQLVIKKTNK